MNKGKAPQPQFDWGPPAGGMLDVLKEWVVYPLLLLLVVGAGWFLLDLEKAPGSKAAGDLEATAPDSPDPVSPPSTGPTVPPPPPAGSLPPAPVFFVQLGAFADEMAAQEMFRRAVEAGFPASMSVPDEQYDMYRLLMGPFPSEQDAEQCSRKLQDLDFPSFVIESL